MFRGSFKSASRKIQGNLKSDKVRLKGISSSCKGVSRVFEISSTDVSCVSREFYGSFKDISRKFQGCLKKCKLCFKKISRGFQECFMKFCFAILLLSKSLRSYRSKRRACFGRNPAFPSTVICHQSVIIKPTLRPLGDDVINLQPINLLRKK